jgi:pantoate--beta-alanine ligase
MAIVFVGLGSNLGDREGNLRAALERLGSVPGVKVLAVSTLVETEPVGAPPPRYLNGAAKLAVELPLPALRAVLAQIERELGRDPALPRNAPRPVDLDVLLWDGPAVDTFDLVVPHPRLCEREFALAPLRELGVATGELRAPERPRVVREPEEFVACNTRWLRGGCVTGLVPTMGALHEGHASLVRAARALCDRVAVTIFVNPLQFGPHEDLARYPRTLAADLELLRACGADLVFAPDAAAMYEPGFASHVAAAPLAAELEGKARPGHFTGVVTVVAKLFALARPSCAFFGNKDAQQLVLLRRMTRELGFPVQVHACPTVREPDGLALSSRNRYLLPADRAAAVVLVRALRAARAAFAGGERDRDALLRGGREVIAREPRAQLDYFELRGEGELEPLPAGPVRDGRLLVAAWFGAAERRTRLIDNLSLTGVEA